MKSDADGDEHADPFSTGSGPGGLMNLGFLGGTSGAAAESLSESVSSSDWSSPS